MKELKLNLEEIKTWRIMKESTSLRSPIMKNMQGKIYKILDSCSNPINFSPNNKGEIKIQLDKWGGIQASQSAGGNSA